jgi:catechol 2,3-dioxygenase-like lactoylglutathione lyase family enzyme
MSQPYPRSFSHIGITVPDLDRAIDFYTNVMGWYLLMGPETVQEETETAIGQMCIDVFGTGWQTFRIAHLSTSDKIGIELFEFPTKPESKGTFEPFKTGIFHFCVQDPDIEGLANKIKDAGANNECRSGSTIPMKNHLKWCTWKIRSEIS